MFPANLNLSAGIVLCLLLSDKLKPYSASIPALTWVFVLTALSEKGCNRLQNPSAAPAAKQIGPPYIANQFVACGTGGRRPSWIA